MKKLDIHYSEPGQDAVASMLWMHGLGADAGDMQGLAAAMNLTVPVRHVFLDAPVRPVTLNNGYPMRAWYDIVGLSSGSSEDIQGLLESEAMVREVLDAELARGFSPDRIFLAGFSQGGSMALYTGLKTPGRLGGVLALSAWIPHAAGLTWQLEQQTPVFMGLGTQDTLVMPAWTRASAAELQARGYPDVSLREYPIAHSICLEEVQDMASWLHGCIGRLCA